MSSQRIDDAAAVLAGARKVIALTGSGISAESGVPTFRGESGLWRQFRAESLATPEAFARDPTLVWEWYDWRRGLIAPAEPNAGHRVLARWEAQFDDFAVITQNVDGLHAKAGSRDVVELHGNIWKARCTREGTVHEARETPLSRLPPVCPDCGALVRPHIVWFGEALDRSVLERAYALSETSQVMVVVGTSAVVQPAASLPLAAARAGAKIIEINVEPTALTDLADYHLAGQAGEVLPRLDVLLRERTGR
jgi:NAD-dependent protein deacetylase/lipoamidase